MEALVASLIAAMSGAGVYLILRRRTFAIVLGTALLSYSINLFLVTTGRLAVNKPPLLSNLVPGQDGFTDPLPQALVLTAIVIGFGITAVMLMMALGSFIEGGDDHVNMPPADRLGPRHPGPDGVRSLRPPLPPEAARPPSDGQGGRQS